MQETRQLFCEGYWGRSIDLSIGPNSSCALKPPSIDPSLPPIRLFFNFIESQGIGLGLERSIEDLKEFLIILFIVIEVVLDLIELSYQDVAYSIIYTVFDNAVHGPVHELFDPIIPFPEKP